MRVISEQKLLGVFSLADLNYYIIRCKQLGLHYNIVKQELAVYMPVNWSWNHTKNNKTSNELTVTKHRMSLINNKLNDFKLKVVCMGVILTMFVVIWLGVWFVTTNNLSTHLDGIVDKDNSTYKILNTIYTFIGTSGFWLAFAYFVLFVMAVFG